jgi:hypothetical protein
MVDSVQKQREVEQRRQVQVHRPEVIEEEHQLLPQTAQELNDMNKPEFWIVRSGYGQR